MKVGGSLFLWTLIAVMFFRRFMGRWEEENTYVRSRRIPDAEITGHDDLRSPTRRSPGCSTPSRPRPSPTAPQPT